MKRDMDLVRRIAFLLEDLGPGVQLGYDKVDGYDHDLVKYHFAIMKENGLLEGTDYVGANRVVDFALRLTWEGHEFLEAARDDTVWKKAKDTLVERAGGLIFDVLKVLLLEMAKAAVLPK